MKKGEILNGIYFNRCSQLNKSSKIGKPILEFFKTKLESEENLMKRISDAELEIMKIIWKEKAVKSKQIIEQVKDFNWNDNTVRTLINRLIQKKAVGISEKNGKEYTFVPLIDEETYKLEATKKFLVTFFHGSVLEFLEFLIDYDKKYYEEICDFLEHYEDLEK